MAKVRYSTLAAADLYENAEYIALLRRFAISLIRQDTSNGSIRKKRKRAAWNEDFLLNLIQPTT